MAGTERMWRSGSSPMNQSAKFQIITDEEQSGTLEIGDGGWQRRGGNGRAGIDGVWRLCVMDGRWIRFWADARL